MLTPSLLLKRLSSVNDDGDTIRTVVFALADIDRTSMAQYLFAMPVEAVERAIVYPTERTSLKDGIGMINFGEKTLTVVDLRQKFTTVDPDLDTSKFLILFHTQAGELCGLPVKDAPVLMDISPATIRSLPLAYREVNQLSFISHMAIVPQAEGTEPLKILLLGLDRAIAQSIDNASANSYLAASNQSMTSHLN